VSADHPLIRMLAAFDARVRDLCAVLADASPALAPAGAEGDPGTDVHAHALRMQAARRIWFAAPVPLDAFIEPGNRIALVAPEMLRELFAARALFTCRDAVRRCVDRRTRRALLEGIGPTALAALADTPATHDGAGDALPEDMSPDALAQCGWRVFAAEGACRNPTLCNVIELSLASVRDESSQAVDITRPGATQAFGTRGAAGDEPHGVRQRAAAGSDEINRFFTAAGRMFPELQWLFG
jgi:Bacterial type III secretion protein (HrpB4)